MQDDFTTASTASDGLARAITVRQDPADSCAKRRRWILWRCIRHAVSTRRKAPIFVQSHVPEHAPAGLGAELLHSISVNWSRATQFKDKSARYSGKH